MCGHHVLFPLILLHGFCHRLSVLSQMHWLVLTFLNTGRDTAVMWVLNLCSPLLLILWPSKLELCWPSHTPSLTSLPQEGCQVLREFSSLVHSLKISQHINQEHILAFTSFIVHLSGMMSISTMFDILKIFVLWWEVNLSLLPHLDWKQQTVLSLFLKRREIMLLFQWQYLNCFVCWFWGEIINFKGWMKTRVKCV